MGGRTTGGGEESEGRGTKRGGQNVRRERDGNVGNGDGRGKTLANVDLGPFNLPNPGGGVDLIEDASLTLTPGRRYGLIGRNGKGKSTLLKHIAARRVKGIDDSYSVHYVTQEVELDEDEESMLPGEIVLRADLQRGLLLDEQARLESSEDANELARLQEVNAKLDAIG